MLQLPDQSVHITPKVVSSNPAHGEVYSIQHYVIKFVSDLRHVGGFLLGTPVSSANKTDCHNITGTLVKVALNTKTINLCNVLHFYLCSLHHCVFKTFVLEVSRDRHAQLYIASLDKWTFEYTILFDLYYIMSFVITLLFVCIIKCLL